MTESTTKIIVDEMENNENKNKARYDNYRLYRLHLETDEHVNTFKELEERSDSYVYYGHARHPDQHLTIMVAAHKISEITDILERKNVKGKVLVYNIQAMIDAEEKTIKPKNTNANEFDWNHYFHLSTIYSWLDKLIENYDFITPINLGDSYEGHELKGIKLSRQIGNTGVFIEGGIHAREWISPAVSTFILDQLINSDDPDVKFISQNFDWYFVPVLNPDGYIHTFESDRLWRKTRKPNGVCRGVDLNRNFDSNWNGNGSSSDSCRYDYAGPNVYSEPEAKHLSEFIINNLKSFDIRTYLSLHSFSQLLMFPYGHSDERVSNYDDLKNIGEKAIKAISRRYGTEFKTGSIYDVIYPSSGGSMDWAKKINIPITYTFELRPQPDSTDMFILPADQIIETGYETLDAFITILKEAHSLGYYNKTGDE